MKTIQYILFCLFPLVLINQGHAQTITKTANKSTVYIGETFTYTITIENVNDFSKLDKIVDDFGPEFDILNVRKSNSMFLLDNWGFCNNIIETRNPRTSGTQLEILFDNCSGSTTMFNRIYIEVDVRLNQNACLHNSVKNVAELHIQNPVQVKRSNSSIVNIDHSNPLELQKSFFKYNANPAIGGGTLFYDVRLSSKSGNFHLLDYNAQKFADQFSIPHCFQGMTANDIEVVWIEDESARNVETPIPFNGSLVSGILEANWSIPTSVDRDESSLLFVIKIKVSQCNCAPRDLFDLENNVDYHFETICANSFSLSDNSLIEGVNCDIENSIPSDCELQFNKRFQFPDNDLGLTMKGCEGKYYFDIVNCSSNLEYGEVQIKDTVPSELDILGINANGWTFTQTGNQITIFGRGGMRPGDSHQIEIGFKVNTNVPDLVIENCAEIIVKNVTNIHTGVSKTMTDQSCTSFKTVPNQVAIVKEKSICSEPSRNCGVLGTNTYLPDDEVEYELFFYNYGNADGKNVIIEDLLPDFLRVRNPATDIQVYKLESGFRVHKESCKVSGYSTSVQTYRDYRNITNTVSIRYPVGLRKVRIDMGNNDLDAFTCKGVTFYKVVIKGVIQRNVRSETYDNQFVINYKDMSIPVQRTNISNEVSYTVNVDNLVLGWKQEKGKVQDCENNTTTVTYSVVVANMGNRPVNVDIIDQITVPGMVSIVSGPQNFKRCIMTGASGALCTPTPVIPSTSFANYTRTSNGFRVIRERLMPCTMHHITYEVVYNTDLLTGSETVDVCNNIEVFAYTGRRRVTRQMFAQAPEKVDNDVIVSLNPELNNRYMQAKSAQEQLKITQLMKAYKADPKVLSMPNTFGFIDGDILADILDLLRNPFTGTFYGVDNHNECATLQDCLGGKDRGCVNSAASSAVNFKIDSINNQTGQIYTTLNTGSRPVQRVEYVLSDIEYAEFCQPTIIYLGTFPIISGCNACDGNVTGHFRPVNTSPLAGLNHVTDPLRNFNTTNGKYREWNTVAYEGPVSSVLNTVNNTFHFPDWDNCSGNFTFTITAIVYFEDCDTCYQSDAIDIRRHYQWNIPIDDRISNGLGNNIIPFP